MARLVSSLKSNRSPPSLARSLTVRVFPSIYQLVSFTRFPSGAGRLVRFPVLFLGCLEGDWHQVDSGYAQSRDFQDAGLEVPHLHFIAHFGSSLELLKDSSSQGGKSLSLIHISEPTRLRRISYA